MVIKIIGYKAALGSVQVQGKGWLRHGVTHHFVDYVAYDRAPPLRSLRKWARWRRSKL